MSSSKPNLDALSIVELQKLLKETEDKLQWRKREEIKVLADGFIKKCQAAGYTVEEAIEACKPYLPQRAQSVVRFQDPSNPENTWTGRGKMARWLKSYIDQGRSKDEFAV